MDLLSFAQGCARFGVSLPRFAEYQALVAAPAAPPQPAVRLLDLTPEELTEETFRRALHAMVAHPRIGDLPDARRKVQQQLADEYLTHLRGHVDDLIVGLRPAFDEAADAARALVALGVAPGATLESMFDEPDHIRRGWREFGTKHAPTLDAVLALRQFMSTHLAAPPSLKRPDAIMRPDTEVDWGLVVGGVPVLPAPTMHNPAQRWLARAASLYLPTCAELDRNDLAVAEGLNVSALLAEARRRDRAGLSIPETTDMETAEALVDLSGFAPLDTPQPDPEPDPDGSNA